MHYVGNETLLLRELATGGSSGNALETFLSELLERLAAFGRRDTDGAINLFEDRRPQEYVATGKLFLIQQGAWSPFCVSLSHSIHGEFTAGLVLFGLANGELPNGIANFKSLEKRLMALPRETATSIHWAVELANDGAGWRRR